MRKRLSLLSAGVLLALGISGCSAPHQETVVHHEKNKVSQKQALGSGIFKSNMDLSVRPQDDFFGYVNGGWLKTHELPADKSRDGAFMELHEQSVKNMKDIITELSKNPNASSVKEAKQIADLYNSYMDEAYLTKLGTKPIQPFLKEIASLSDKAQLSALFGKMGLIHVDNPLGWYVHSDAKNSGTNTIYFYQSGLGLPDRDYYFNQGEKFDTIRKAYQTYVAELFSAAKYPDADNAAKRIYALEEKIAKHQWTKVENRDSDKTYNKLSSDKIEAMLGDISWADYTQAMGIQLDEAIISQPSYLEGLAKVFSETDLQTWKDYLSLQYISGFSGSMGTEFEKISFEYYGKTLSGQQEMRPRWKRGISRVNSLLGEAMGKVYVDRHFKPEAKERMENLVSNLIKAYEKGIKGLEWMSEETKERALVKLSKFKTKIGYPDKWKDYSDLTIKSDDLVGNQVRYSMWRSQDSLKDIGEPVDRDKWLMTPQTVNAYYLPTGNEIVFPAAILQPPFFNLDAEDAVNYGAIGAVIGHEIGHGFDDQGAKYDGDGNLQNWWAEKDLSEFQKRGKALVDRFNSFKPFDDAHVNGELTLGENIGDLGGVTIAYEAYKMSLNGKASPKIDGFTGEQRFYIGYAQAWKVKAREKVARQLLLTDPHSPPRYRVNGILPNVPAFYEAFSVKEGDKMYLSPNERVKIW